MYIQLFKSFLRSLLTFLKEQHEKEKENHKVILTWNENFEVILFYYILCIMPSQKLKCS